MSAAPDAIDSCLKLVPIPYLSLAFNAARTIWGAVNGMQQNKTQFVVLAETVATLLVTLDKQYRGTKELDGNTKQRLDEMLQSIEDYVQKEKSAGLFKVLIDRDQRRIIIGDYLKRINAIANLFQISALIDIIHWQTKIEQARKEDKEAIHNVLDQLLKNQQQIMGTLVQDQLNIGVVMVTLQRLLEKREGDHKELEFFQVSVQNLQRMSGKHVEIQPWTVTALEVEFGECIGAGGFGQVYRGRWNKTEVALKVMLNAENTPPNPEVIKNEVKLWSNLRHPHILQFLGANILDSRPFIVMPFIKKGNVQEYILRNPECNRLELTYHISLGLTHLHAHNVIHGDLKALNVLIDDGPKALLADFGLSKIKANSNSKLTKTGDILQGSLCWMAPEIFQGKRMKTPCDIYALAMTIFEIFTGEMPWADGQLFVVKDLVLKGTRPERPEKYEAPHLTDEIWKLIEHCWNDDPVQRPFASNVAETLETLCSNAKSLPGASNTTSPTSETAPSQPMPSFASSITRTLAAGQQHTISGKLPHVIPPAPMEKRKSMPPAPVNQSPVTSYPQSAFGALFTSPGQAYNSCIHLPLPSRVSCVAQSLHSLSLAVGHSTGDLTIWDIEKKLVLRTYTERSPVTCVAFQPNANSDGFEKVVIGTRSGTVMVREPHFDTLQLALRMKNPIACVCLTQNGDIQAIDNKAFVGSKSGGLRRQVLGNALPAQHSWTQYLFSPEGNKAWVGFPDGGIVSVNLRTGQRGITLMAAKASSGRVPHSSLSQISPSRCVNINLSPNGDKLAACYASGEIRIWDVNTGANRVLRLQTFASRANWNPLYSPLCFSRRGPYIIYPSLEEEKTLVVQNVESGELLYAIPLSGCLDGSISYIAISPDDKYITVMIEDSSISIFSQMG